MNLIDLVELKQLTLNHFLSKCLIKAYFPEIKTGILEYINTEDMPTKHMKQINVGEKILPKDGLFMALLKDHGNAVAAFVAAVLADTGLTPEMKQEILIAKDEDVTLGLHMKLQICHEKTAIKAILESKLILEDKIQLFRTFKLDISKAKQVSLNIVAAFLDGKKEIDLESRRALVNEITNYIFAPNKSETLDENIKSQIKFLLFNTAIIQRDVTTSASLVLLMCQIFLNGIPKTLNDFVEKIKKSAKAKFKSISTSTPKLSEGVDLNYGPYQVKLTNTNQYSKSLMIG